MTDPSSPEVFEDHASDPAVVGFLHRPQAPCADGLVLTHGAGSNCNAPLLLALARTFCAAGFTVLRCDLPFRQSSPYGPPSRGHADRDREGIHRAVKELRKTTPGRIFLGGHSYGGRQSTMLVSAEQGLAAGLLLLSYPLHPPRKPEQLRTQHFINLRTPALFIQGTRDPFGSVEELRTSLQLIPARTRLLPVEGAGHDLDFGKKGKAAGANRGLPVAVLRAFQEFFS
jgi:hypothetical protein